MQLFINNWATMLTAPAGASAGTFSVPLADAAKLTGLGAGDHYLLTLAEVDGNGLETAWETVKVTASAAGVLTALRGLEGTTARDWAASTVISARVTKGMLEELRGTGNGGGDFLTRENFIVQAQNGALGIQSPIAIFCRDNVGAYIYSVENGALRAMLPWLTPAPISGFVAVGPYIFHSDDLAGIVVDDSNHVALSTGTAPGLGCSAVIFAYALVSDASSIALGSFMQAQVRTPTLSGGDQQYILEVVLSIPPYGSVSFRYGSDYSESVWSVWWMDAGGTEQSFVTSRELSTFAMSSLRIEISGSYMRCKESGEAIHTIPLDNLYKDESTPMGFGVEVILHKVTGATPTVIGLDTPSGQLILHPL